MTSRGGTRFYEVSLERGGKRVDVTAAYLEIDGSYDVEGQPLAVGDFCVHNSLPGRSLSPFHKFSTHVVF